MKLKKYLPLKTADTIAMILIVSGLATVIFAAISEIVTKLTLFINNL